MLVAAKQRLAFVSTRFLFPADSGGKIRTGQILRGMKGGRFHITLLMPCTARERETFAAEIDAVCDRLVAWTPSGRGPLGRRLHRTRGLFSRYPIPVYMDQSHAGSDAVAAVLDERPDLVVFDFPHSAVLAPPNVDVRSLVFTHNVEAEIFDRHRAIATAAPMKALWASQHRKMLRFERRVLENADAIVAVSSRDCEFFSREWGLRHCRPIPTGVDTDYLSYRTPESSNQVVFCGSMDWKANVDAMEFFHERVWPHIKRRQPDARMKVVGRAPPGGLVRRISEASPEWEFTGFVDDIRDHVGGAGVFVIPLRVGSGTRIKAYEAMAMGTPVVSTRIGIEGLSVTNGQHFLAADDPGDMADSVVRLLGDPVLRRRLSSQARSHVESRFGYRVAAAAFEEICITASGGRKLAEAC